MTNTKLLTGPESTDLLDRLAPDWPLLLYDGAVIDHILKVIYYAHGPYRKHGSRLLMGTGSLSDAYVEAVWRTVLRRHGGFHISLSKLHSGYGVVSVSAALGRILPNSSPNSVWNPIGVNRHCSGMVELLESQAPEPSGCLA